MSITNAKYVCTGNENVKELCLAHGLSEEKATGIASAKPNLEVAVSGNNYTITTSSSTYKFTPGTPFNDTQLNGEVFSSIATVEGGKVTLAGKKADGSDGGSRVFEFTASGATQTINVTGCAVVGKIFYSKA